MKKLKFILVMLLICSMVLPLTACPDDGGDDDWGNTGGGNNKGKTLTIVCYEGGFGSAWLTELAKQFGFDKVMPIIDGSTSTYPFTNAVYNMLFSNGENHPQKPTASRP